MPNTREKLIDILDEVQHYGISTNPGVNCVYNSDIADHLIANGVTVQEGKPLEAFLHPVVAYEGLKAKYLVFKADTGAKVDNCFILRPDKDPAAVEAIRAYASATDNETLAEDIYNWVGKGKPVPEWISVKDRLPEEDGKYLVFEQSSGRTNTSILRFAKDARKVDRYDFKGRRKNAWYEYDSEWGHYTVNSVTHWQYLPQPPKGE